MGLTLLALVLGWALVFWGDLDAAVPVRLLVAAMFGLTMGNLDHPAPTPGLDSWWMRHGDTVVHTGFLVSCAVLLVSVLLSWTGRLGRIVDAVLRGVVLAVGLCMFFLGRLAMYVAANVGGQPSTMPFEVDSAISSLAQLSLPLIFVAGIVVVDLALDVSTSLEQPARRLSARWALGILLVLLTIQLLHSLHPNRQLWADLVHDQLLAVAWTVGSAVLLVALVAVTTRFPLTERFVDAKEKVIYLGSVVLAGPILLSTVGFGIAIVWFTEFDSQRLGHLNNRTTPSTTSRAGTRSSSPSWRSPSAHG